MEEKKEINIKAYIHSLCEVFTPDNKLLFAGIVQECPKDETARIIHHKGEALPRSTQESSTVKLRIHPSSGSRNQLVIYRGTVIRSYSTYWDIQLTDTLLGIEHRKNFRQYINKEAFISCESSLQPCLVADISLTGLGIKCGAYYEVESAFIVTGLSLKESGAPYEFFCTVRRRLPADENGMYFYGCSFTLPDERTEDLLYRDILKLQATALKKRSR